jgi:hypothetical protein
MKPPKNLLDHNTLLGQFLGTYIGMSVIYATCHLIAAIGKWMSV